MRKKALGAMGAVVMILAMVLSLGGWALRVPYQWILEPGPVILTPEQEKQAAEYAKQNNSVGLANPFQDCKTMGEAEQIAGFSFQVPEKINGYPDQTIQVMDKNMIQVFYKDRSGNEILLRKAKGTDDVTGDYNVYKEVKAKTIDGKKVTMNCKDGKVYSAYWTDGKYAFAVDALDKGVTEKFITQMVRELK